jgi:hypothetical protein
MTKAATEDKATTPAGPAAAASAAAATDAGNAATARCAADAAFCLPFRGLSNLDALVLDHISVSSRVLHTVIHGF